ncbi:hypothetical protein NECID01_2153 [Nematocida sp. AWRm77]|nr:hypothetical protein NECID01_2153 [Nematocida sp. AWRm77]
MCKCMSMCKCPLPTTARFAQQSASHNSTLHTTESAFLRFTQQSMLFYASHNRVCFFTLHTTESAFLRFLQQSRLFTLHTAECALYAARFPAQPVSRHPRMCKCQSMCQYQPASHHSTLHTTGCFLQQHTSQHCPFSGIRVCVSVCPLHTTENTFYASQHCLFTQQVYVCPGICTNISPFPALSASHHSTLPSTVCSRHPRMCKCWSMCKSPSNTNTACSRFPQQRMLFTLRTTARFTQHTLLLRFAQQSAHSTLHTAECALYTAHSPAQPVSGFRACVNASSYVSVRLIPTPSEFGFSALPVPLLTTARFTQQSAHSTLRTTARFTPRHVSGIRVCVNASPCVSISPSRLQVPASVCLSVSVSVSVCLCK